MLSAFDLYSALLPAEISPDFLSSNFLCYLIVPSGVGCRIYISVALPAVSHVSLLEET